MEEKEMPYEKQIFVCTNTKDDLPSCGGDHSGQEVFKQLRAIAKERGLHPRIRVAQAKCLGKCGQGGNIMVYPDNTWFSGITVEDVPVIAERYLSEGSE